MSENLENPWQDEKPALALYAVGPFAELLDFLHSDRFKNNLWTENRSLVIRYYDAEVGGDSETDLQELRRKGHTEYPFLGKVENSQRAVLLLVYTEEKDNVVLQDQLLAELDRLFNQSRPKIHCSLFMPSA